ncbi:MAG: helix-turn-helix domain-containing protein [Dechloromonas sp.]|nr:helix-turn-helix domain-containing protein [Dechloromonas sp.]
MNDRPAPQRIRAEEAAAMLGISHRGVQALAARGDLPGAAKIGTLWTFDPAKLRRFISEREAECLRKTSINAAESGGCAPPSGASNIEKAYERAMSKLRGDCAIRRSRRSRRRAGAGSVEDHGSRS